GYFIGFNDIYSRIVFICNSYTSEIVRVSTVTFLRGDLVKKEFVYNSNSAILEYYVIFFD
ncbi:hypothetical protein QR685DRAFT_437300, partial [Neurospora intermedia]